MSEETIDNKLEQLYLREYEAQLEVGRLRRAVYGQDDLSASANRLEALAKAEKDLERVMHFTR
ncbi:MAG: hypothetical protein R3E79_00005 [Caldilineaceae bacterium]